MLTKIKMLRSWQGWEKNEKYEMDVSTATILINLGYAAKLSDAKKDAATNSAPVDAIEKIKSTKKARIENVK